MTDNLSHMPIPLEHSPRHVFGEAVMIPRGSTSIVCEQKHRTCVVCGATRITLIGAKGFAARAWRLKGHQEWLAHQPPCLSAVSP